MEELSGGNSAPASSTGPTTFEQAFASDASPASDPSATSTTPPAAEQPATDAEVTPEPSEDRSPFIPRARFDEVNTKMNELKQWREQYGWAEGADQQAIAQAQQIGQLYSTDRAGFIRQLLAEAINDPALAPAVRSEAARLLGTRQAQAAPEPEGPDLTNLVIDLGNGQTVPLAALKDAWSREMEQKFAPVVQTAQELREASAHLQQTQQAQQFASGFFKDLQKLPDFDALKPEIAKRLATERLGSDHPAEVQAATYRIYMDLQQSRKSQDIAQAKSDQLDDLQRRAAASTSPNPGSAAPSSPKKVTSFYDKSLQW